MVASFALTVKRILLPLPLATAAVVAASWQQWQRRVCSSDGNGNVAVALEGGVQSDLQYQVRLCSLHELFTQHSVGHDLMLPDSFPKVLTTGCGGWVRRW